MHNKRLQEISLKKRYNITKCNNKHRLTRVTKKLTLHKNTKTQFHIIIIITILKDHKVEKDNNK